MKISIIIPVYNAATVVERALLSILFNQGLDSSEFEIICINDGSIDASGEILMDYSTRFQNVICINQLNKGLGGARNTGIQNATGEYIIFLDADDYILPGKLNALYKHANEFSLDILEFGVEGVSVNGNILYKISKQGPINPITGEAYYERMIYMDSACNKLYSNSLLRKYGLRFKERIFIEDVEFNTRVFLYAKRVMCIPDVSAHFVVTPGSITRNKDQSHQFKMFDDLVQVIGLIQLFVNQHYPCNSVALPRLNEKVNSLVISLLYRCMQYGRSLDKQNEILLILKKMNLYPVNNCDSRYKNYFKIFVNQPFLFLLICRVFNLIKSEKLN